MAQSKTRKKSKKSPGRLLPPSSYDALLRRIVDLNDSAGSKSTKAKLNANWRIGGLISSARLSQKSGYHNTVIKDLAADSDMSVRVLQESVRFHQTYAEVPEHPHLNWSHYRKLMWLAAPERRKLQAQATKEKWSVRDLATAIAELPSDDEDDGEAPPIPRPTDPTYLFKGVVTHVVDGDTIDVDIDLGFQVIRQSRLRLARIDTAPLSETKGRKARDYLLRALHGAESLVLTTERIDLHGRYVAHLFTSPRPVAPLECFQTGQHLNNKMVTTGHALAKPRG